MGLRAALARLNPWLGILDTLKATRTLNPLHFEDLEPHRFEDLVRQLAYGFRNWHSIEAVGRLGSDEGIDIRAVERSSRDIDEVDEDGDSDDHDPVPVIQREWIFQCKRERRLGPKRVSAVVADDLGRQAEPPYAYVLAAACDFSKAARDAFRDAVVAHGVEEFHIWGKAEIEDKLFLPSNDHLLFAYFGISIQARRRSVKTTTRSRLTMKRRLAKVLGEVREDHYTPVLVRDYQDEDYPALERARSGSTDLPWRYWYFDSHQPVGCVGFVTRKCYAYANWETGEWDALLDHDLAFPYHPELYEHEDHRDHEESRRYSRFADSEVPKENQAWYEEFRAIPYDRVVAVDEIGDRVHEGPHLLVEYLNGSPFEERVWRLLTRRGYTYDRTRIEAEGEKRIDYFPDPIPDLPEVDLNEGAKDA